MRCGIKPTVEPSYQLAIRQTASFPDLQATTPFPGASRGALPPTEWIRV
jgi:hypothetical protein